MNTYNNNEKITENDIIELESWLMYAHKDFNSGNIDPRHLEVLSRMINSIKPKKRNPKFNKK
jgi:hypothetical protein